MGCFQSVAVATRCWRLLAAGVFCAYFAAAAADGFHTTQPTVLFDAPSAQARPKVILSGAHPVRQVSSVEGWRKVLTHGGDEGWVAQDDLRAFRGVVVSTDNAAVRVDPNERAAAVFLANRGVVLEVLGSDGKWMQVVHKDGESGYILSSMVWRNY